MTFIKFNQFAILALATALLSVAPSLLAARTVTVINNTDCNFCQTSGSGYCDRHDDAEGNSTYICGGCGTVDCVGSIVMPANGDRYDLIDYALSQIALGTYSGSHAGTESAWGGASASVSWNTSPTCTTNYEIDETEIQ